MAVWFSSIMTLLFLASSFLYLVSCEASGIPFGLRKVECARGTNGSDMNGPTNAVWAIVVALGLVSFVLYAIHTGMAIYVSRDLKRQHAVNIVEEASEDPEIIQRRRDSAAAREKKARDKWTEMQRMGYIA